MGKELHCPHCGHEYVRFADSALQLLVAGDDYTALPVSIDARRTRTGGMMVTTSTSPHAVKTPLRGDYVVLTFECESCEKTFSRYFGFHKGNTYEGESLDDCQGD